MPDFDPSTADARRLRRGVLTTGGLADFIGDGFTDCLYLLLPLWAAA